MRIGKRWKPFVAGMLTMALLIGVVIPSLAAGGLTTLYNVKVGGIRIVIDGQELHPTDSEGIPVDPMIYNGTTYLPVRAVSSAVGKAVYWDGPTYTVYLGKMDGKLDYPTVMLKDMTSIADWPIASQDLIDNYGNSYGSALTRAYGGSAYGKEYEYLLNMKYSRFKGTLYIPEGTTTDITSVITIEADGKQIYSSGVMNKTSAPIHFDVNVTGCNDLKIIVPGGSLFVCIGDAGFYQ